MANKKNATGASMTAIPKGAKVPQDHKPKEDQQPETKTVSLHDQEWTVPVLALDDFELLDDLQAVERGEDLTRLPSILRRLVGDEDFRRAMDACRDPKTKRVTVEKGSEFVFELMGALNPNSSGS